MDSLAACSMVRVAVLAGVHDKNVGPDFGEQGRRSFWGDGRQLINAGAEDVCSGGGFAIANCVMVGDGDHGGAAAVDVAGDGGAGPELRVVGVGQDRQQCPGHHASTLSRTCLAEGSSAVTAPVGATGTAISRSRA